MNASHATTGDELSILVETSLNHRHTPNHSHHTRAGVLASEKWPVKTPDINVERNQHCKKEQDGYGSQNTSTAMQRKEYIQQDQDDEKSSNREPEHHEKHNKDEERFNDGESWSADFLNLGIHDARAIVDKCRKLSHRRLSA